MGDMADDLTDSELDNLGVHQRGECDGPCQYCEADEKEAKLMAKRIIAKNAGRKRSGQRAPNPPSVSEGER